MKKFGLILLCLLLFAAVVGGAAAWFMMTPRGVLRSDLPEDIMQRLLEEKGPEGWRAEYIRLCPPAVSEFESADKVAGDLFDAAAGGSDFTFRAVPGTQSDASAEFIVSAGNADLFRVRFRYVNQKWGYSAEGLDTLRAETRTLSVTVPEDTALKLNGRSVDAGYIAERGLPYDDMTELERRFDSYPTRVRYEIGGICEAVTLTASREGGLTELYSDGTTWEYTLPDAGSHAFAVKAPSDAVVTVNGAVLTADDVTATAAYPTRMDIPGELQSRLPGYYIYTAGGLYSEPQISASLSDGTALTPQTAADGTVVYTLPVSQALYDACHARVEDFLMALCEYGAGHTARYAPGSYAVGGSTVANYITRARASLYWTVGVATSYGSITSSDYVPLGADAFLCRGHVVATTTTKYQTRDLDIVYEMLWVRAGNQWMVRDLDYSYDLHKMDR